MLKRGWLLLALFLVLPLVAAAEVDLVERPGEIYRLGSSLTGSVEVEGDEDATAVLSASLVCDDVSLDFYASLFTLSPGSREDVTLPELPVTSKMVGSCRLEFTLRDLEDVVLDETESASFEVTDVLSWEVSTDKEEYDPGESLRVSGTVSSEENVSMNVSVIFRKGSVNESFEQDVSGGSFSVTIPTASDLGKGKGSVKVTLTDEYGNGNSETILVQILGKPTTLGVEMNSQNVSPGDVVVVEATVYDQEGSPLAESVDVRVLDPQQNLLSHETITSGQSVAVTLSEIAVPGMYTVDVQSVGLSTVESFEIPLVKDLAVAFAEGRMILSNRGNVPYVEETTVQAAEGGRVTYQVPLFLNLQPNERRELDLNNELPEGTYVVTLPMDNATEVFEDVEVFDRRSTGKKLSQGFSKITGRAVINTQNDRNIFGLIFLALFVAAGFFLFSHSRLKSVIMNKFEGTMKVHDATVGNLKASLGEEKSKRLKMQKMFNRYVNKDVLAAVEKEGHMGMQKRSVTVLFTDIRGFSHLFDHLDDLEVTKMLDMYFKRANEIIVKEGGVVDKFIGDSVMAIFNAPKKYEDHVLRAARAALALQREVNILNERLKKKGLAELRVGTGLDTGIAAVGNLGGGKKIEYTAIGVPVNIAARLQSISKGGQVFLSDRVYDYVKSHIEVKKIGQIDLKHISRPVIVYEAVQLQEGGLRRPASPS